MRVVAVIIEGQADAATEAAIRQAMEAPEMSVLFARPLVADVVRRVSFETGIAVAAIAGRDNTAPALRARCAVALLARQLCGKSMPQIGIVLDHRDHSTILNALRKAERFMASDPAFRMLIKRVADHFDTEGRA